MAWGTLKEVGWVNAFTSGKYATDNYVKYQIDESSRKLRVIVTRQRVRSLDSAHSYNGNVNNGCRFLGGGEDSQYFDGYDTEDIIVVTGGGSALIPSNSERTIGRVYTYNNDGSVPSITLSTQMIFDLSGYDKTTYKFSNQDWKSQELKSKFPTIAKKAPNVDPVTNVSVTKVSANSITVNFNLSQYAIKYSIVAIAIDDSGNASQAYSTTSTGTPATITGLSPNTKYKVGVSAIGTNNDMSDYVYVNNVTTLSQEQSPVMVNVDGIAKQVINAYINVNGVAKRTVAIYVNVNGTAKKLRG